MQHRLPIDTKKYEFICQICDTYIHELSKHCRECNRCVEVFDHHCQWLNNCIGIANYRSFLMLISLYLALSILIFGLSIHFLIKLYFSGTYSQHLYVFTYILLIMSLIKTIALTHLFGLHTFLIMNNMTTFDYIMEEREINELREHLKQEIIT